MASEIRVNSLSSRTGLSTVTFTDTGPIFSGITTFQDNSGFNVGTGGSIFSPASNTVTLGTNSAERLRITSDGKIGVNNTSPLSDLQVITAGQTEDGTFRIGGSAAALGLVFDYDQSGATVSKITANPTYTNTSSLLKICVDGDANPNQLVLKGDGNIGVGVANPSQKFMVKGIIASEATNSTNNWMGYTYTDNTFRLNYNGAGSDEIIITSAGHLLHGVSADEDTSGNGGLRFINSGDIQIDGDQKALVFRSTNNTAQLQSAIEWWNENGAGVQSKIACDRTAVSQAPSDLVFYTSSNVDLGGAGNDGAITERLRITSAGETLISNNTNRFLSLDRTNASSGSGEFNVNVEVNSQTSISYDDGAPLVIGTCSSPRTQTGFSEKVRISSEGYVTKGNHPSFRVGRHTDYNHTGGQPVQFNTTTGAAHLNRGNHYSTSNHRFVAPVAGVYQFSACIIVNGIANNTDLTDLFYLYKNGTNMAYSMRRGRYVSGTTGTNGYYVDFMSNVNVLMAANDYCDIICRLSLSIHGNSAYTWFSGTLVG